MSDITYPTKVVINKCTGGFDLSEQAWNEFINRSGIDTTDISCDQIEFRSNPLLISIVSEMGEGANGPYSDLRVETVQGDFFIRNNDGFETVNYS